MTGGGAVVSMDFVVKWELTSMTDPKLEEQIELVKVCLESLRRFHEVFENAILTETVVPEDEGKLQELRASVPQQWESVFDELGLRRDDSVAALVEIASSLSAVVLLTEFQTRKLYDLSHKAYMKLHFFLGRLQYRKESLASFHPAAAKARKFLTGAIIVIVLAGIALLIYSLLQ